MTINAARKIISLTGPNCSFANANACRVDVVAGAQGPAYAPIATWSAADGTVNNAITGWAARTGPLNYSSDVAGPFGGAVVVKEIIAAGAVGYGGQWIANAATPFGVSGDELWFRFYVRFASDFAFNYGTFPADGNGHLKFIRFEDASGARYTVQLAVSSVSSGTRTVSTVVGGTDEVGSAPNPNDFYSPEPAQLLTRDAWHCIEVYMLLSDSATNAGKLRVWIDDTYLGEKTGIDNVSVGSSIDTLVIGNYWNGGSPQSNTWYFDELILTRETPDALDSGGRPFIGSSRKVADF